MSQVFDLSRVATPVGQTANTEPPPFDLSQVATPVPGAPRPEASGIGGAIAETAGRGFLQSGGALGGAALGAKIGAVGGPPGMVAGGLVGLVGGYMAGEQASESLGLRSPEQLPEELRSYGYFGESLGGAVPFAAAPFALAARGTQFAPTRVGNFLNQIINTAKTRPKRMIAIETGGALGAATFAGVAEEVAPGSVGVRVGAEVAGGVVGSAALTRQAAGWVFGIGRKAYESMSTSGRETAAARTIAELLEHGGEDPAVIARILNSVDVEGTEGLTAAQKTGSEGLIALEKFLTQRSSKFGAEAQQSAQDALDAIRGHINLLSMSGDPAALQAAAEARSVYYRLLINDRLEDARERAITAAQSIAADTPEARAELSVQARDLVMEQITEIRKVESELWSAVPDVPVEFSTLQQTLDDIAADLLPEVRNEKIPSVVRRFIERVSRTPEGRTVYDPETLSLVDVPGESAGTTLKEMRQLRSELLDQARTANTAGDYGQARILNNLAESILDDIDIAFRESGDTAYAEARTFSREFNDTFTRSFVGKTTGVGKYGDRIAPELTLTRALASGKEAGAIQLAELEEASRFLVNRGFGDDTAYAQMVDVQERFIRLAAAQTVDPTTGRASVESINRFIRDNSLLMNRFPEVKNSLQAAAASEDGLRGLERLSKNQIGLIENQKVFGGVIQRDPIAAARQAIISTNQERAITDLVRVVRDKTGKVGIESQRKAMMGLRSSILTAAQQQASRSGTLRPDVFRDFLFNPTMPGSKSPIQIMQEQGVVDAVDVRNMRQLLDLADSIARSQGKAATALEVRTDVTDAAMTVIARMVGSGMAGTTAKAAGSTTPSLIVHGAGARFTETLMNKIPQQSAERILIAAMTDRELMTRLLTKASMLTPAQQAAQARYINAWLIQSGLTGASDADQSFMSEEQQ
jgi:hypothetical protein